MKSSFRHIILGVIAFVMTIIVAVSGYVLAGWSLLDAVYMSVITMFGVGYGEVQPVTSPTLRVFTILVIVAGYTSVVYIVGGVVQMVTEGEINKALDSRRMTREIETLQQHVIICGFGRIGEILARRLEKANQQFIIIDSSSDALRRLRYAQLRLKQKDTWFSTAMLQMREFCTQLASVEPRFWRQYYPMMQLMYLSP